MYPGMHKMLVAGRLSLVVGRWLLVARKEDTNRTKLLVGFGAGTRRNVIVACYSAGGVVGGMWGTIGVRGSVDAAKLLQVFMGMGEPLANYNTVMEAVRRINTELGIGARHITISTVGLAPRILRLAQEDIQVRSSEL